MKDIGTMKKIVLAGALLGASQLAGAAWTASGTVTKLQMGSAGDLFLTTTAALHNPAACTSSTYFLANDYAAFNSYYAMLLTAKAAGDNVKLYISDSTCTSGGYPLIQGAIQE